MLKIGNKYNGNFFGSTLQLLLLSAYLLCFSSFSTKSIDSSFFLKVHQDLQLDILENIDKCSTSIPSEVENISLLTTPNSNDVFEYQSHEDNASAVGVSSMWGELRDWWDYIWSTEDMNDEKTPAHYERMLGKYSPREIAILSKLGYIDSEVDKKNSPSANEMLMMEDCTDCPPLNLVSMDGIPNFPMVDLLNLCSDPDTASLLIYNPAECAIKDINLEIIFDTGLSYGGFVFVDANSGASATIGIADLSNVSRPQFSIDSIGAGAALIIDFAMKANCAVDVESDMDVNFDAQVTYGYEGEITPNNCSITTTELGVYNSAVKVPVLNVLSVSPQELQLSQTNIPICQTITISQDGINAFLNEFQFQAIGLDTNAYKVASLSVNGSTMPMTDYSYNTSTQTLSTVINGTYFPANTHTGANGDNFFDTNERLTVEICYEVIECTSDANFLTYQALYGCDGQVCGDISSMEGTVNFIPAFNADVQIVTSTLVQGAQFCGNALIFEATIESANSDPDDGLWRDLVLNWDACNSGTNTSVADVQLNDVSVPFTTNPGGDIVVDLNTNTAAITGLIDADSDGFIDDLPGGNSIKVTTSINVNCVDTNGACASTSCTVEKIEVTGKRNCSQSFQDFANINPPITWNYGETSFDTYEDFDIYGDSSVLVTESHESGDCSTWLPFADGLQLTYEYGFENITGCTSGNIYAVIDITGSLSTMDADDNINTGLSLDPISEWADVRYLDGSATYEGAAAATSWMYTSDPITGDTTGIRITINAGSTAVDGSPHDYYFNLETNGHCSPADWLTTSWKVYQDCSDCTDCTIVRSCHEALTHLTWNNAGCVCSNCSYTSQIDTFYRCNVGWTDKTMTTKVDPATIPQEDFYRFIPGDTMYVKVSHTISNVQDFEESFIGFNANLRDPNYLTDGQLDMGNAQFIDIYKENGVTGDLTPLRIPCLDDYYPPGGDPLLTTWEEQQRTIVRLQGVPAWLYADPSLSDCNQQMHDATVSPNWPFEQTNTTGINPMTGEATNIFTGNNGAGTFNGIYYEHLKTGSAREEDTFQIFFRFGEDPNCIDTQTDGKACYQEFLDLYDFKQGDKISWDIKIPIAAGGFNGLDAFNDPDLNQHWGPGGGYYSVRPYHLLQPNFETFTRDPITCDTRNYDDCAASIPYDIHVPGPVVHTTEVVINDCDIQVEHIFTLTNETPPLAIGETPWFQNEYRPIFGVEYIEPFFPNNLVYQGGMEIEDYYGTITIIGDEWIDLSEGNVNCTPDGAGGICCAAADSSLNTSIRIFDQAYIDGQDPCWNYQSYDLPLRNKAMDPFPLLSVGGANDCNFKLRYNLTPLCPAQLASSDFGLNGQFAHTYVPDWISLNHEWGNNAGVNPGAYYGTDRVPADCLPTLQAGNTTDNRYNWPVGPNPMKYPQHRSRQVSSDVTTPGNFTDNSSGGFPPLMASVSQLLISDAAGVNETNTYQVCAESTGGTATHVNVVTSIEVPNSIELIDVQNTGGTSMTWSLSQTTATSKIYSVVTPDLAPGVCADIVILTELLFCPIDMDVDTRICIETTSGCIAPAKAASLLAGTEACIGIESCYEYISEEADIQAEWNPNPAGPYSLCETIPLGIRIKNVKPATLVDLKQDFWLPPGLNFVSGSFEACYPGGPGNVGGCMPIPDPIANSAENSVYGTNYGFDDMSLVNSYIHSNGLVGILSSLDSNNLMINFEVETICDDFISGTSVYYQVNAADPCEQRVQSMFVESDPILINGALPSDFAQFYVFADPVMANCGSNATIGLTYLNVSPIGESQESIACIDLDTETFNYMSGSIQWVSPTGHNPMITEEVNGATTKICFTIPDGIASGEAFQMSLDVEVPDDVACDTYDMSVRVSSEITDVGCVADGSQCIVNVLNSVNPLVNIEFLPPLQVEEQQLTSSCAAVDGTVDLCYEINLKNTGPTYNDEVAINIIQDVNANGMVDAGIDTQIGTASQNVNLVTNAGGTITGCINVNSASACPIILQVEQITSCVCNSQGFAYNSIPPSIIKDLAPEITLCEGDALAIANCGGWTYSVNPSGGATMSPNGTGDSLYVSINSGFGTDTPVELMVMSTLGGCSPYTATFSLNSLSNFTFGPYNSTQICSEGCTTLDLNIPKEYENNVTVQWTPATFLDDAMSLSPMICNPTSGITYSVTLTIGSGTDTCIYMADYPITVDSPITNNVITDDFVCPISMNRITAPSGYLNYEWKRVNGDGSTSTVSVGSNNTWTPTEAGTYLVEYANLGDICSNFSNEFTVTAIDATASISPSICNPAPNNEGTITVANFNTGARFAIEANNSYTGTATFDVGSTEIPIDGIIVDNLVNPSSTQDYTVRVFSKSGCYVDRTVTLIRTVCRDESDYEILSSQCSDNPCHEISNNIYLGSGVTVDNSNMGSANADTDVDDGVSLLANMQFTAGNTVNIPVTIYNNTSMDAYLRMWIDWNGDGDFEDAGEQVENSAYPSTGAANIVHVSVTIPSTATQTQAIALRTRLSTDDANSADPCGNGSCAADGEVEDYLITVDCSVINCPPVQFSIRRGN